MATWTEETVKAAGTDVQMWKAGSGEPLVIVHDELGYQGDLRFHNALAENHTVYIPSAAGFGKTDIQEWIMTIRDMANWYLHVLDDLGLQQTKILGLSFGGWIAAEMAAMEPSRFKKMVLVAPMGIKPPEGEIVDMFVWSAAEWIALGVHDKDATPEYSQVVPDDPSEDLVESWETAREEACRLGWKPYMYDRALPNLLGRVKNTPTLMIWGKDDTAVPVSAAGAFEQAIQGSKTELFDKCGHYPHFEQADQFIKVTGDFLKD
jgi:pimeloyl-ACP methyl ester carboxylesterase